MRGTFTPEGARARRQYFGALAVALLVLGLGQLGYGGWAAWSDAAVKPVFAADRSCDLTALADTTGHAGTGCTFSGAFITSRDDYGGKSGSRYSVRVYDGMGAHERVSLGGSEEAHLFWRSLIVGRPLRMQRFVVPGYHITGQVVAVSDGKASLVARDNPLSNAAPNVVNITLGLVTAGLGAAFGRSYATRNRSPS